MDDRNENSKPENHLDDIPASSSVPPAGEDGSYCPPTLEESLSNVSQGGPIWKLACEQAQKEACGQAQAAASATVANTSARRQWAEALLTRTQSRATPTAPVDPMPPTQQKTVVVNDTDEHPLTAHKRVQVAQLLIAGIVGILMGWLGNAVVGTSCHFASVQVPVGRNAELFTLHFGLYKYSTVDSSLNGYVDCLQEIAFVDASM